MHFYVLRGVSFLKSKRYYSGIAIEGGNARQAMYRYIYLYRLSCVVQNDTINRYLRGDSTQNSKLRGLFVVFVHWGQGVHLPPRFNGPRERPGIQGRVSMGWRGSVVITLTEGADSLNGVENSPFSPASVHPVLN